MTTVTTAIPNAIIFVLDPNNKHITVPGYAPGELTASNASCISVATISEVDGEVTLRIIDPIGGSGDEGLVQVFDGSIETPGKRLAVVTSQNERILEADVTGSVTRVTISVDDPSGPGLVHVVTRYEGVEQVLAKGSRGARRPMSRDEVYAATTQEIGNDGRRCGIRLAKGRS